MNTNKLENRNRSKIRQSDLVYWAVAIDFEELKYVPVQTFGYMASIRTNIFDRYADCKLFCEKVNSQVETRIFFLKLIELKSQRL